jgi:uncharacterized small protein (TIGR04563 family)
VATEGNMAKKKVTLYFPEELVTETKQEALRQDRSMSWVLQMAWMMSREQIKDLPGIEEIQNEFSTSAN